MTNPNGSYPCTDPLTYGEPLTMRDETYATEHLAGWIESTNDARPDQMCYLCLRERPAKVRRIEYSRNGFQSHPLVVCADCRPLLVAHLNAED